MLGGTRITAEGLGWPQMASDGLGWPRMASSDVRLTRSLLPSLLMASADSTATSVHASMYYNPSTLVSASTAWFCACNCSCEIWFREIRARQNAVLTPS